MSEVRKCDKCGIEVNLTEGNICGCWRVEGQSRLTPTSEGKTTYVGKTLSPIDFGAIPDPDDRCRRGYNATEAEHKVLANTLRELRLSKNNHY